MTFASPVKYMVVRTWYGSKIIDTSREGDGKTVERFLDTTDAHLKCRDLNHSEGYTYAF